MLVFGTIVTRLSPHNLGCLKVYTLRFMLVFIRPLLDFLKPTDPYIRHCMVFQFHNTPIIVINMNIKMF